MVRKVRTGAVGRQCNENYQIARYRYKVAQPWVLSTSPDRPVNAIRSTGVIDMYMHTTKRFVRIVTAAPHDRAVRVNGECK